VADGIRAVYARGRSLAVDVSSGVESAKGIKDHDKIRDFVAAVRSTSLAS
jgi:phosphoribosylanthranilate isomerase